MSADDWQSQKFRQSVISKINEMLQANGQDPSKNAGVMENHIFKKSRTRDEYLGLVAKLFVHFKDLARTKQPPPQNPEMHQQSMMQDPLNALQNLASQGNRNPQMMSMSGGGNANQMAGQVPASNLLQTLNQHRPGQQQAMPQMRGQMPMGGVVTGGPGGQMVTQMNNMQMMTNNAAGGPQGAPTQMHIQNQGPMNVQQIQQINQNQMMNMNHPQLNQMMNARMSVSAPGPGINTAGSSLAANLQASTNTVNSQMHVSGASGPQGGPQTSNLSAMLNMPPHKANMQNAAGNQLFAGNRTSQGQQQFMRQSGSPSSNQQQAPQQTQQQQQTRAHTPQQGPGTPQQPQQSPQHQSQQQVVNQQQSVANQQSSQMIPSPALAATNSPQMPSHHMGMANNQRNMSHPSPSGPGSVPPQMNANSPFNPNEEHLYREKYKQLTKYIEPLKRMLDRDRGNSDKMAKMNKLLEILSNPNQRVPLETLLKCEKALDKMELFQMSESRPSPASAPNSVSAPSPASVPSPAQPTVPSQPTTVPTMPPTVAIGKSANPLLEVVTTTMQSSLANHTLYRTFRPVLDALCGTDIVAPKRMRMTPPPEQKPKEIEFSVPFHVQGEVARLDPKFKVKLDQSEKNNAKSIRVVCALDDKRLPSVPPVHVTIPEEYPQVSPVFSIPAKDYSGTAFLKKVQSAMLARIAKLPARHSLTQLLDCWEMSVRQACSPDAKLLFHDLQAIYGV